MRFVVVLFAISAFLLKLTLACANFGSAASPYGYAAGAAVGTALLGYAPIFIAKKLGWRPVVPTVLGVLLMIASLAGALLHARQDFRGNMIAGCVESQKAGALAIDTSTKYCTCMGDRAADRVFSAQYAGYLRGRDAMTPAMTSYLAEEARICADETLPSE